MPSLFRSYIQILIVGLSSNYVHGFKGTEMLEMRLIGGDVVGTVWVVAGPKRCCR